MSGTVRNRTDGNLVSSLEYQAYEPMAMVIFRQIAATIRQRWPETNRVAIQHRIGRLQVGEISVLGGSWVVLIAQKHLLLVWLCY